MASQKIWSNLQKAKDVIQCPLSGLFSFVKLIFKLIWLLLNLKWTLVKKFFSHLFSQRQDSKSSQSEKAPDQHDKIIKKGLWQKFRSLRLSDFEKIMQSKIKSFQLSIPKRLSKWFPGQFKFDNSKLKVMTVQEMRRSSNQVLVDIKQSKDKDSKLDLKKNSKRSLIKQTRVYYVPTYLRVKVKNFTAIDLDKLEAEVNVDVIISFVYGNDELIKIPKQVAVRLLNEVVLNFERDEPLKLDETDNVHISTKEQKEKYHIQFTVRKKLHMRIQSRVYYTPFEQLYLILPITIQQLTPKTVVTQQLNPLTNKMQETCFQASIKFNYMDNEGHFIKLDFTDEKHFGYYSLIETGLVAKYSNKRITSIEELEKYAEKKEQKGDKKREGKDQDIKEKDDQLRLQEKNKNEKTAKIQQINQENQPLIAQSATKEKTSKKAKKKQQQTQKAQEKTLPKIQLPQPKTKQQKPKTSKDSKDPKPQKQQLKYFQYSFFKIPIYKHPMASLVMIFLPLWSLAIINLGIFFQQNSLSERIASIASLMIAFIALNETIRSQIPPHPRVVFVQLLVYAEMIACFLCLVNSYEVSQIQNYKMVWTECKMFMMSLGIFVAEVVIILVMGVYHYYIMVPAFELSQAKPKFSKIQTRNWGNEQCDKHFNKLIEKTIEIMPTHRGLTESKKLKDINEELMKRTEKPSQKVDSEEIVLQVLKSLSQSLRKVEQPMDSQSIRVKEMKQQKMKEQQQEKPRIKRIVTIDQN